MKRRTFMKGIGLAAAAAVQTPQKTAEAQVPGDAPGLRGRRPNIIFLMADDIGYGDLGCYGQQRIATPNIDQLAAEGLRFTQAYAGAPVCTSSRCVLMTGLHNGHTAARDNIPHYPTYLQENDITVAEVLKKAGYRCGGVGKWSLGDAGTVGCATNQGMALGDGRPGLQVLPDITCSGELLITGPGGVMMHADCGDGFTLTHSASDGE